MAFNDFAFKMIDGLIDQIANLANEARASEAFQEWLKVQTQFHHYSWHNTALIYIQGLRKGFTPTRVAGAKKWAGMGRNLKPGVFKSGKLWILAPIFRKEYDPIDGEERSRIVGFRNVYVFDISQTTGKPLPELEYRFKGDDQGLVQALEAEYARRGIELEYVDGLGGAKGVSRGGSVKILSSLKGAERAATLAHELAHEILHWGDDKKLPTMHSRSTMEIEAEAASMVILGAWGLEYEAGAYYLACWEGDRDKVKASMGAIARASKSVLEQIIEEKEVAAA